MAALTRAGRAGWVLAAALGLAWLCRRRLGEFEVWKGHAHLHSNRPLDQALRLAAGMQSDGDARVVVRRGGVVLAEIRP